MHPVTKDLTNLQGDRVRAAFEFLSPRISLKPRIGIIAGTGLGSIADAIEDPLRISFDTIPHFPTSSVQSHDGILVSGKLSGAAVICLRGRVHLYEGWSPHDVVLPVRVLSELGVNTLIVTNAAGGINRDYRRGQIMLIADHINLQGDSPLIGVNNPEWGPRFPDLTNIYDEQLQLAVVANAKRLGVQLNRGVYAGVVGPNLETRAEYTMLARMGVDAVGMSTTMEAVAACHVGMRICGFSVITDECIPESLMPVTLEDVLEAADAAGPSLIELVCGLVADLSSR